MRGASKLVVQNMNFTLGHMGKKKPFHIKGAKQSRLCVLEECDSGCTEKGLEKNGKEQDEV